MSKFFGLFICLILSLRLQASTTSSSADIIVYGGTASGVMTAYSAAKQGLHVILLDPGTHLGGMVTGGLSATDLGDFNIIGGYVRDFYLQAALQYGVQNLNKKENWLSEPHVDEALFHKMLAEAGVTVYFHERIREHAGVQRSGTGIVALTTQEGKQWHAKIFADCSYEGDLIAQANEVGT